MYNIGKKVNINRYDRNFHYWVGFLSLQLQPPIQKPPQTRGGFKSINYLSVTQIPIARKTMIPMAMTDALIQDD